MKILGKLTGKKIVYWLILLPVSLYLASIIYLYVAQHSLMYHPKPEKYGLNHYKISNTKEITLTAEDGTKLQSWFRKPDDGKCDMVIFLHGNYGSLDNRADKLQQLADMGYGFIIPAWRSFGKSEGQPSMQGLYADARAAIDYLKSLGYKTEDILLIGESLGTGIAAQMATEQRFKGLFLITPYTSIVDCGKEMYPLHKIAIPYATKDNYQVLDKITQIKQPLLIIHGTNDVVVPHSHSEKIIAAAHEPKRIVLYEGIGHSNYDVAKIFKEMREFFGMSGCVAQ